MAVVRKDITTDAAIRDKYIEGVLRLKRELNPSSGLSTYDALVIWHVRAMMTPTPPGQFSRNAAHRGPVFLPWHRYMLIVFEQQLQRVLVDDQFGLPYWAWHRDGDLAPDQQPQAAVWGAACMGGSGDPVTTGPFANPNASPDRFLVRVETNSSGQLVQVERGLARGLGEQVSSLPTSAQVRAAISLETYDEPDWGVSSSSTMRNVMEGWQPDPPGLHNRVHVWIGGDMTAASSPNDPAFFLNHANEDRLWAAWQRKFPNSPYLPDSGAPAALRGHRLNDDLHSLFPAAPKVRDMLDVAGVYGYDTFDDVL